MPKYKLVYSNGEEDVLYFKNYVERDEYIKIQNSKGLSIVGVKVQNKVEIIPTDYDRITQKELTGGNLGWRRW